MQFLIDIALSLIYLFAFLLLCAWAWRFWKMYVNQKHLNSLDWVMLEIKLPREIFKSPYATEVAIAALLQGGGIGKWYHRNFKGNLPIYSSLEIASIEGVIHFYVRVQRKFRSLVETNFYAQYPGIEIVEADDYTGVLKYDHHTKDVNVWGVTYRLGETWTPKDEKTGESLKKGGEDYKMPKDFFPIKTYVDYELNENPKEEFKVDPLTHLLEFMGSIGKGEHFWYQLIVQDEAVYNDKKFPKFYVNEATGKHLSLSDMADMFKKQLRTASYKPKGSKVTDDYGYLQYEKTEEGKVPKERTYQEDKTSPKREMELTPEEKWQIEVTNKKLGKPIALAVMRLMYVAKKENAQNIGQQIQNTISFPKPFAGANSFIPKPTDPYDYPWQDMGKRRSAWRTEEMFEAYVEREGFFPHVEDRKGLDSWEDMAFWSFSMRTRKIWRMLYEGLFHPFSHPSASGIAFALNTEEIATLWHLPGAVATTPTLPRIESNKGVAPPNIPR